MKQKLSAILSKTTSIRRRAPCHGKMQQLITMDSIHVIINLIIIFSPGCPQRCWETGPRATGDLSGDQASKDFQRAFI
jgi:hypothetical protein